MKLVPAAVAVLAVLAACSPPSAAPSVSQSAPAASPVVSTLSPAEREEPATATSSAPSSTAGKGLPRRPSKDPATLAADLNRAIALIHDPATGADDFVAASRLQQLSFGEIGTEDAVRAAVLPRLTHLARTSIDAFLTASDGLGGIEEKPTALPEWRIVAPAPAEVLYRAYTEAESTHGIPWYFLASINFIETRMGRIRGDSTAGARGPMQFIPSTWEIYGAGGDIDNDHDAIFAAARLLVANGGPSDMDNALFNYNPDTRYVRAVRAFAERMRDAPREFLAYHQWQVVYTFAPGAVVLPVGFPAVPPEPLG